MESNICNCPLQNPSIAVADNCPIHNKAATALPEELVREHNAMEEYRQAQTLTAESLHQQFESETGYKYMVAQDSNYSLWLEKKVLYKEATGSEGKG